MTTSISEVRQETAWTPWVVCFAAALFFFYEFIQGNMFASVADDVMRAFHIDLIASGWLSSIYYLSNVIFLFPASVILDKYSTRKVILAAMLLCVAGTFLFAVSNSFYLALVCRFLTGIGSAFCFLSCVRLASRWFPSSKMALVTGLMVTMAMFGGMVAQTPLTVLIEQFGWRQAIFYDGMLGLLIVCVIYFFVEDCPASQEEQTHEQENEVHFWKALKFAYSQWQNMLAALYTSLMNMPVALLGAYIGSMYLVQSHHYLRTDASSINGMLFLGTIIGGPLIGAWSDKIGLRRLPMILGTVLSMFVVVFILYLPNPSVLMMEALFFALGFFTSAQILSYPLVAENVPLSMTATCVGVVSVLSQGGILLYQNLFSYLMDSATHGKHILYDAAHAYQHALLLIPYGFIIALLCVIIIPETRGIRIEDRAS